MVELNNIFNISITISGIHTLHPNNSLGAVDTHINDQESEEDLDLYSQCNV